MLYYLKKGGCFKMLYLKDFYLPTIQQEELATNLPSSYPFGIFPYKRLEHIRFAPITIFYGNNGSGKSTLLNILAEKLHIPRTSNFITSEHYTSYVNLCKKISEPIPRDSKFISSEDVFSHILEVRLKNSEIDEKREELEQLYTKSKYSSIDYSDFEQLSIQNEARSKSRNQFVSKRLEKNIRQFSNGETAISYFNSSFSIGNLYLLDEPENSLAPKFQIQLASILTECARYCDCQFIIASHSPFLLSMQDVVIYDLDTIPVITKPWYKLENMKLYYKLFHDSNEKFK